MTSADEEFGNTTEVDDELEEVDTPNASADDETEEVDGADKAGTKPAKKAAKKANARPPVPEGFIAPVAFAKELTKRLQAAGKLSADTEIPPQMIYAYIKSSAGGKNPLPTYSEGGRNNLLKLDEALAWWDAKEQRSQERNAKKAAKPAAADVEEAEGASAEVTEAE